MRVQKDGDALLGFAQLALIFWAMIAMVQLIFAFGTAERIIKSKGARGNSALKWHLALIAASFVPGLVIYLRVKYRKQKDEWPH